MLTDSNQYRSRPKTIAKNVWLKLNLCFLPRRQARPTDEGFEVAFAGRSNAGTRHQCALRQHELARYKTQTHADD